MLKEIRDLSVPVNSQTNQNHGLMNGLLKSNQMGNQLLKEGCGRKMIKVIIVVKEKVLDKVK